MRVLAVNYEFPPLGGGAGNATDRICRELVRLGCEVEVLTSWFPGTARLEARDGYRVRRLQVLRRRVDRSSPLEMASFTANACIPLLDTVRRFKPDILHVYFGIPTGPLGLLARRLFGTPYLLSLRGGDVPGFLPETLGAMHRATAPLNRRVWEGASVLVANSAGLRDLASEQMGLPVELVPNGVDLDAFSPAPTALEGEERQGRRPLRALFVGRLVEQKGVRYLLEAMEGLPLEATIAGAGPEEDALRRMAASLGIQERVRFCGWVGRDALPGVYREADVFVFPSFEEGMPNVVLEAMASGLPVVATDIYGHRELVTDGENGFLVPVADPSALKRAFTALCRDPALRSRMGSGSRQRAREFSWASSARAYLALSRKALQPQAVGAP